MNHSASTQRPWWSFGHVWLLIAGPAIVVVAGFFTYYLAVRMPDPVLSTQSQAPTAGQGTTLGRSFEELAAIIELVDDKERVGVCFDTCHTFAAGYDIRTVEGVTQTLDEFDQIVGIGKLKVLHLNDSKNPLGSNKDRHDHIGEGLIGLEGFRGIVNDPRLRGLPAILETEKDDEGEHDRRNLAILREMVMTSAGVS